MVVLFIETANLQYYCRTEDIRTSVPKVVLAFLATFLTTINCGLTALVLFKPSARLAITISGVILVLEIVYLAQTILYILFADDSSGDERDSKIFNLSVLSAFLSIYTFCAVVLYRFWEFLLFNYDDAASLLAENLIGDQRQSFSQHPYP